jgi:hypothetical protein
LGTNGNHTEGQPLQLFLNCSNRVLLAGELVATEPKVTAQN